MVPRRPVRRGLRQVLTQATSVTDAQVPRKSWSGNFFRLIACRTGIDAGPSWLARRVAQRFSSFVC